MEKKLENLVPRRFLPAPFPLKQSLIVHLIPEPGAMFDEYNVKFASLAEGLAFNATQAQLIANDLFCSSVTRDVLEAHMCKTCGVY